MTAGAHPSVPRKSPRSSRSQLTPTVAPEVHGGCPAADGADEVRGSMDGIPIGMRRSSGQHGDRRSSSADGPRSRAPHLHPPFPPHPTHHSDDTHVQHTDRQSALTSSESWRDHHPSPQRPRDRRASGSGRLHDSHPAERTTPAARHPVRHADPAQASLSARDIPHDQQSPRSQQLRAPVPILAHGLPPRDPTVHRPELPEPTLNASRLTFPAPVHVRSPVHGSTLHPTVVLNPESGEIHPPDLPHIRDPLSTPSPFVDLSAHAVPQVDTRVGPADGRAPFSSRLFSALARKPTLSKTWEKRGFAEERRAPLPPGAGDRRAEEGLLAGGAWGSGGVPSGPAGSRPTSLYASPAAVAAFRPMPMHLSPRSAPVSLTPSAPTA